ncbi:hypothetical protein [Micromonospora sp. WMMA1947]|uniref:methylation-associated defense system protein MAD7 n=1 Tax=Micromonospora sp. WMMA1947 TaxID=3015163 RepID=UPI00248C2B1E|nr:hypothetical protein [Micromonospora sp. WMMA1947]WBC10510.1 hypothetical protein O7604_06450 [Micromonospora sp. WMMA1947]
MGLHKDDKEFRHPAVSYLDYKQLDMDRVLTALLPRLRWKGSPSVLVGSGADLSVDVFVEEITKHPDHFVGFDPEVTARWLETHLLDLVNRGKPGQAIAGLRPLHGFTYRFRVARRSRPYGADEQLYWMLHHGSTTRGTVLEQLKRFFFAGVDQRIGGVGDATEIDVETQTLINLCEAAKTKVTDREDRSRVRKIYPPLDTAAAELLTQDVTRLLYHRGVVPRSVLVDHLKILFAFHLARYHFRIMKTLPIWTTGDRVGFGGGFFLDVAGVPGTPAARLAETSAQVWYDRIPAFVQATFTVKKLDDFGWHLVKIGKLRKPADGMFLIEQLLSLLGPAHKADRGRFAEARLARVVEAASGEDNGLDPQIADLLQLKLDPFATYIEIITAYRIKFHRGYLTDCLDSLLLKHRPGAMLTQPRRGQRRFVLDSRLLEVLLQLALLRPDGAGALRTAAIRVDEFLAVLRDRYGLYIDELPPGDGFGQPSIIDHRALRENRAAFVARLREIGFYTDLSDAYLTQTITPRYRLEPDGAPR